MCDKTLISQRLLLLESSRMSGLGYTQSLEKTHNWGGKKRKLSSVYGAIQTHQTMPRHFICALWMSACVLYGCAAFLFNGSAQHRTLNLTNAEGRESVWESPFLQLRASLLSYSQPVRPYSLLTNVEDHHYLPKPAHRRASRLLRLLGSSFDPFWMSVEKPSEASGSHSAGHVSLHGDKRLKKAAALGQQKLEKEAAVLDLDSLPPQVASSVRVWLVHSSTCRLRHRWVDLGPAFWPRWLRQTDCERSDGGQSCSFPGGMQCMRAQITHIKILAWHCLERRGVGDGTGNKSDVGTETEMGEFVKRCVWRQVPYPVVTACTCSCKWIKTFQFSSCVWRLRLSSSDWNFFPPNAMCINCHTLICLYKRFLTLVFKYCTANP